MSCGYRPDSSKLEDNRAACPAQILVLGTVALCAFILALVKIL